MPIISVAICTFNRAELLATVLETACNQSLPQDEYEILVIDNNSTDATAEVVKRTMRTYSNVRYFVEVSQGLSHARNRGWQEARGEYVAYTDDDCKLPREWLAVAKEIIRKQNPEMFGGPYYAFYNSAKPLWFKDSYASSELSTESVLLNGRKFLRGPNMFFRRDLLAKFNGFNTSLGMTGKTVAYGEDGELQRRIRNRMPEAKTYYTPELFVYHLVRPEKMTLSWEIRSAIGKGRSRYLEMKGAPGDVLPVVILKGLKILLLCCAQAAGGFLFRDRSRYPYYRSYLYEHIVWRLAGLGRLYEQLRRSGDKPMKTQSFEAL